MRLYAVLLIAALLVGCSNSGVGVAPENMPSAGTIWFGQSYDPQTFALTGRSDSFAKNQQVALVAHLSRPSRGEAFSLSIDFGAFPASWPGGQITSGLDVMAEVLPAAEMIDNVIHEIQ